MTGKVLGKISSVNFGFDKDRPFLFGLGFMFKLGDGAGIGSGGKYMINISEECKWTAAERKDAIEDMIDGLAKIMEEAKVTNVADLKGIPVEIAIAENTFKGFRILTEVL